MKQTIFFWPYPGVKLSDNCEPFYSNDIKGVINQIIVKWQNNRCTAIKQIDHYKIKFQG